MRRSVMATKPLPPGYSIRRERVTWTHPTGRLSHPWRYIVTAPDGHEPDDFARYSEAERWIADNHFDPVDGPFYVSGTSAPPRPPYGTPERAAYDITHPPVKGDMP
jgi:hypothetical protein